LKHRSIYRSLLWFGFAIGVIPVLAFGVFSYVKSSGEIRSHMDQTSTDLLRQLAGNVEQVLKTADTNLNQVVNSAAVQDALYQPITSRQFALNNSFRKNLSNLQSGGSPVADVVLLNFSDNWLINNERLYEFEEFPSKDALLAFNDLPYDSTWSLRQTASLGSPSSELSGCKYTIALSKKLPVRSSEKRGLALAYIPSCRLDQWVDLESDFQDMFIIGQDRHLLFHRNPGMIGMSAMDTGYITKDTLEGMAAQSGQLEVKAGGGNYTLTYVRSDYNSWVYVLVTDLHLMTEQSTQLAWVTFFIFAAIVSVTLCFVWLGSRSMYTPIQSLLQRIGNRQPAKQAQNEFQLIEEHLEHLSASNSYMKKEISQNTRQLRVFFLMKLYQGQLKEGEVEEQITRYGFGERVKQWDRLAVVAMQTDTLEGTPYAPGDADLLLFAANNIVEESLGPEICLPPVTLDQTQITLIGAAGMSDEVFRRHVYGLTETMRRNIEAYLKLSISMGISLPFGSVREAARGHREAADALKHRLKLGTGVTIHYADINRGHHSAVYHYPRQLLHELTDAVKLADEEKALALLHQWMGETFSTEHSPGEYQIALVRLLNDLMILMQESGIVLSQLEAEEYAQLYNELLQLYVPGEIEKWFARRLLEPMARIFQERGDSQYRNLSEAMIDMIHKRYDSDFTLEECASILHYNTHYLSGVFKRETNQLFSEYLAAYRVHMAKKWLVETDMPVKDIAERLTYNNSQNFIRFFRKQEGMTPGQYRERNRPTGGL
jgi:AraC-like DNA-binding protein